VGRRTPGQADDGLSERTGWVMPQTKLTDKNGKSAKWQRRRSEIVDASAKVFADRGYHATSTTELCEANGIGKGALYYYIGSKEELLAAIHDRVMDEVMLGAARADLAGGAPPERLAMLGEELLDVIFRFPDHVWVFLHDFRALTGKNAELFRQRRRAYERRVEAVFRRGIESGEFRPLDTRLAVSAWLGMHNYTYLGLRAGEQFSVRDAARSFADIFVSGIATRGLILQADQRLGSGVRYPVTA
jgi:TetR/AcrR family transcriptional regulator, cholesterol catabolism regulator